MTRAEMRRQAKQKARTQRFWVSRQELDQMVRQECVEFERKHIKETNVEAIGRFTEIFTVALYAALRKQFKYWGKKRNDRLVHETNLMMAELGTLLHHGDDKQVGQWCWMHGLDSEQLLGIKQQKIQADPYLDEEGNPVIYIDWGPQELEVVE